MVDFINENLLAEAVKGEHLAINWDVWISLRRTIVATKTLVLIFDQPGSNVQCNDELKTIQISVIQLVETMNITNQTAEVDEEVMGREPNRLDPSV